MQQLINDILHDMSEVLSAKELYTLQIVLQKNLNTQNNQTYPYTNLEYMDMFISAKRIEGCSERTLAYYKATIEHMLSIIVTPLRQVQTDDLRTYLAEYQLINNCSKTTIDNIRRNLSSFFSWLEAEDYIIKSPIRRIHKIRRSMATRAIDKGMPIEQVQKLLGHQQIDTTMHYAMVNQYNVKISHRKFIG